MTRSASADSASRSGIRAGIVREVRVHRQHRVEARVPRRLEARQVRRARARASPGAAGGARRRRRARSPPPGRPCRQASCRPPRSRGRRRAARGCSRAGARCCRPRRRSGRRRRVAWRRRHIIGTGRCAGKRCRRRAAAVYDRPATSFIASPRRRRQAPARWLRGVHLDRTSADARGRPGGGGMTIRCTGCGRAIRVPDEKAQNPRLKVKCTCGTVFALADAMTAAEDAASAERTAVAPESESPFVVARLRSVARRRPRRRSRTSSTRRLRAARAGARAADAAARRLAPLRQPPRGAVAVRLHELPDRVLPRLRAEDPERRDLPGL